MLKAQEFFTSSNHGDDEWKHVLSQYDDAIKLISLNKKKPNLIDLDKFWRTDFPTKVFDLTTPMRMTLSDISNIMTWKITRGKFRPLQKLVDSNKSSDVESISQSAFKVFTKPLDSSSSYHDVTVLMQENFNWKPVMEKLMSLKAIGPATASAILAPLCPQQFPFMSDEAMLASEPDNNSKKEYTLNAYTIFRQRMITKAKELGMTWSAEAVGRTIWTYEILFNNQVDPLNGHIFSAEKSGKKKNISDEKVEDNVDNSNASRITKRRKF